MPIPKFLRPYPKMGMTELAEQVRIGETPGIPEEYSHLVGADAVLDIYSLSERRRRVVAHLRFPDHNIYRHPNDGEVDIQITATQTKDPTIPPQVTAKFVGRYQRLRDVPHQES